MLWKTDHLFVRRLWQFGIAGGMAYLVFWLGAYYATESPDPTRQFLGMLARLTGPKYQRTVRESSTNMALFHLRHAMSSVYNLDQFREGRTLAASWEELVQETRNYRGPHLAGKLLSAYPLLGAAHDPWGRPWVYRIVELETADPDATVVEITFGSLGPDGQECPPDNSDYDARRRACDDILERFLCDVPRTAVP